MMHCLRSSKVSQSSQAVSSGYLVRRGLGSGVPVIDGGDIQVYGM